MNRMLQGDSAPYQQADHWNKSDDLTYAPETKQKASKHGVNL